MNEPARRSRLALPPTAAALACLLWSAGAAAAPTEDPDANMKAVQAVCGRCHSEMPFLGQRRTWPRWNDVFRQMAGLGATGTQEQLEQVTAYFLDHLTVVNVNTGSPDELAWVLDVSDDVATEIVRRRGVQAFSRLSELAAVPGVRAARLERLKGRIQF